MVLFQHLLKYKSIVINVFKKIKFHILICDTQYIIPPVAPKSHLANNISHGKKYQKLQRRISKSSLHLTYPARLKILIK